jgi:anaerobic magnesium-protoporphyrin IX monomethyl ester cyclase
VDYVFFFDHLFTLNKQHLVEFSRKRAERGLDFSWGANAHVNLIDEDYAALLAGTGCTTLHFGVESGSERMLSFYRKRINPEKVISAFKICASAGIEPGAYFIVGAPNETEEDVEQSARLLSRLRPSFVDVSILAPMPGTPLFESTKHRIDEQRLGDLDNRFAGSVYKDLRIDPLAAREYLLSRWER